MTRFSIAAFAVLVASVSACAPSAGSIRPRVLAAADPASAEAPVVTPATPLERRVRTLELEVDDPTRMHHAAPVPTIDHSHHATPDPTPKAAPTKRPAATPTATPAEATTYVCPMHSDVRDTKPGVCPKCGMTLEAVKPSPSPSPYPSPSPTVAPPVHHHGGSS